MTRQRVLKIVLWVGIILSTPACTLAAQQTPVLFLTAVTTAQGPLEKRWTNGESYPVLEEAPASPLIHQVHQTLEAPFPQFIGALNQLSAQIASTPSQCSEAANRTVLYISEEDGGFARYGFWLKPKTGPLKFCATFFVDLTIDEQSLTRGEMEEVFAHETGHIMLHKLAGGSWPNGLSRAFHSSLSITDYPTAFNEGWATHFQAFAERFTQTPGLEVRWIGGQSPSPANFWLSRIDGRIRIDAIKQNLAVHRTLERLTAEPDSDLYHRYVAQHVSDLFDITQIKSGQQMMASEGVIATTFYKLLNAPEFAAPDASQETLLANVEVADHLRPLLVRYAKIFRALHGASKDFVNPGRPPLLAFVESYGALYPSERPALISLVVGLTYGATADHTLARSTEALAVAGAHGNIEAFGEQLSSIRKSLSMLSEDIAAHRKSLGDAIGLELWVAAPTFKISTAPWDSNRTIPLTVNLNTAEKAELLALGLFTESDADQILRERIHKGSFADLTSIAALFPQRKLSLVSALEGQAAQAQKLGPYKRQ